MNASFRIGPALLSFALLTLGGLAQSSIITTYVGPQLPINGAQATTQFIDGTNSVASDDAGGFYVASNCQNRMYRVAADGAQSLIAGSGAYGFRGDGGPATSASRLQSFREMSKMSTNADADNKQVLVDTFRNLVRYALLKTNRDLVKLGVTPSGFSLEAMDESLAARANAGIFGERSARSLTRLLEKAHDPSLTFHFYWKAPSAREPLEAAFALSYEPAGDLKARLLWLGLPERVPISPRVGVIDGRKPLEEAVFELLRVLKDGRLAPYPPPR